MSANEPKRPLFDGALEVPTNDALPPNVAIVYREPQPVMPACRIVGHHCRHIRWGQRVKCCYCDYHPDR